ncbi:hypothetical protein QR680_009415 [Steinernema hermaphroditum]|uniref:Protein VAC14 homolog n=1 Tax=Steinernema hermaphroditum TaxID=289476 RepID=A0AA39IM77_9BILA|nr:hypothetical protein QR680_009415 [Steinernema hermaphroditum]
MSDAQYAPLTVAVVRTLTDKLYERRKQAALDIEKQVRELVKNNHISQLEKLLSVLKDLTIAQNGNTRKGGLIGMAAAAIALGKEIQPFTTQLVEPVLTCFSDTDARVRYYACESLYNIVKIARNSALVLFDRLFDTLWKLSSDQDQNVRSGAELLDRLLKDIVSGTPNFDVEELMVLTRKHGYAEISTSRRFIVSWMNTLLTVPEFSVLVYLPEVLDQLFFMLGDEDNNVRDITRSVLGQFLGLLGSASKEKTDLTGLVNILVVHAAQSSPLLARQTALIWMARFVTLFGTRIVPNLSAYLTTVLPSIHDNQLKAKEINRLLMELVTEGCSVDIDPVVTVLLKHIHHDKRETRMAVLNWIKHMHSVIPDQIIPYIEKIFSLLLTMLSDTCDDVLLLDLHLLSDICEQKQHSLTSSSLNLDSDTTEKLTNVSPYLIKFCISILEMFRSRPSLMTDRGVLIVRRLCLLLDPSHIYQSLSLLLLKETNLEFVSRMVAMLNSILLTATELFVLREQLKKLDTKDSISLFSCVYRCWCHQPIALLGLCLLSQNYAHACDLVEYLSHIDITVELLVEIDRLVQLIESPILAYIRLDLLNATHQQPLAEVLSALLMLLPQTDAFTTLHKRLQAIPAVKLTSKKAKLRPFVEEIAFADLINHFESVSINRQNYIRQNHRDLLASSTRDN